MSVFASTTLDEQGTFDRVAAHLLTQMQQSRSDLGACAYRGQKGRMCGIGCLIPNELYSRSLENKAVNSRVAGHDLTGAIACTEAPHEETMPVMKVLRLAGVVAGLNFLRKLQIIHDSHPPSDWAAELIDVANTFGLSSEIVRRHIVSP